MGAPWKDDIWQTESNFQSAVDDLRRFQSYSSNLKNKLSQLSIKWGELRVKGDTIGLSELDAEHAETYERYCDVMEILRGVSYDASSAMNNVDNHSSQALNNERKRTISIWEIDTIFLRLSTV